MENAEIEKIYSEASGVSHIAGLRAVFDAGVKSVPVPDPVAPPPAEPVKAAAKRGR